MNFKNKRQNAHTTVTSTHHTRDISSHCGLEYDCELCEILRLPLARNGHPLVIIQLQNLIQIRSIEARSGPRTQGHTHTHRYTFRYRHENEDIQGQKGLMKACANTCRNTVYPHPTTNMCKQSEATHTYTTRTHTYIPNTHSASINYHTEPQHTLLPFRVI